MTQNRPLNRFVCLLLFLCVRVTTFAQTDPIERMWYNEEKTAKIHVYKSETGKFCGRITWLREPDRDGKPKVDMHNPDKARHNDPILGLLILKGFVRKGDHTYDDGTIYDPKNGKTYKCTITHKGDKLDVRGYVGFSFIGRTTVWTPAE